MSTTVAAGFLAERLAKASAVPAEQRSADVCALIESCALQAELVEELALPDRTDDLDAAVWRRWSPAAPLKLVRSHFVSPSSCFLDLSPQLQTFATFNLYQRTSSRRPSAAGATAGLRRSARAVHAGRRITAGEEGWGCDSC